MKTKKIEKKLVLQKGTISDLNSKELNEVKGGLDTYPIALCGTFYRTCDPC